MKVSPRLQEIATYLATQQTTQAQSSDWAYSGDAAGSSEALFNQLLEAQLRQTQRVVTAEEILADLDGTPTFQYTGVPAGFTYRQGGFADTDKTDSTTVSAITEKINKIAARFGVDADLVREVVRAESNFNPNAVSRVGAKGLMQLMDGTARAMQVRNVYDPDQNIAGGTKYLRNLLDRYDGNVKVALAAYNAGPGRISKLGIDSDEEFEAKADLLPEETQRYVAKIMNRLDD